MLYAQTLPGSDFHQYDLLAQRLANGEGYVDEFGDPSAFYAIGWPFFLSIVYRVFGYSLIAAQLINALLSVASVILTFAIARHWFENRTALIASLLVAINPTLILYSSIHATEPLFIFQILLLTWLLIRVFTNYNRNELVLVGVLTGLAILVRPVAVCVPLGAFVAVYITNRHDHRANLMKFAIIVGISAVIVAPWVIRNAVAVGATTLQTSSALVLWIGHNPQATGGWMPPPPLPGLDAVAKPGAGANSTEAEASSVYTSAAIDSILDNPSRILTLMPRKMFELWAGHRHAVTHSTRQSERSFPDAVLKILPILTQAYLVALLVLVIAAYVIKKSRIHWITGPGISLTGMLFFWNAYHTLNYGSGRHHVPMEPFLAIMAASALSALLLVQTDSGTIWRNFGRKDSN